MKNPKYNIEKASEYLVCDDELTVEEMVEAIIKDQKKNPNGMIDHVDGVSVWQKVELEFTNTQFLELISIEDSLINRMKLVRDEESVNIFIDEGDDKDPIHVCYWHCDEWLEDAELVVPAITRAMELFYTDKQELLNLMGIK